MLTCTEDSTYLWEYPYLMNSTDGEFGLDSKFQGNAMRFVNHDDNNNVEVVYVPWRYLAQKVLKKMWSNFKEMS